MSSELNYSKQKIKDKTALIKYGAANEHILQHTPFEECFRLGLH